MSAANSQNPNDGQHPGAHAQRVAHRPQAQRMRQFSPQQLLADPSQYFDELMKTEVDDHTVGLLKNMFGREMMLGNIDEADYHEVRWLARNLIEFVYAEHPDERSTFVGNRRKMLSGDYGDGLRPLNGIQRAWIEMSVFNFLFIVSRSKSGFQQEMNSKTINVQEARRQEGRGGLTSLIPGM